MVFGCGVAGRWVRAAALFWMAVGLTACGSASLSEPGESPCASVDCGSPPEARCEGNLRVTYSGGVCDAVTVQCVFTRQAVDCGTQGGVCVEGVCVPADEGPCVPEACTRPPAPYCDGSVVVVKGAPGSCPSEEGACAYPVVSERDCADEGLVCRRGRCATGAPGPSPSEPPSSTPPSSEPPSSTPPSSEPPSSTPPSSEPPSSEPPSSEPPSSTPPSSEPPSSTPPSSAPPSSTPPSSEPPSSEPPSSTPPSSGAGTGLCAGVSCPSPPESVCEGTEVVRYSASRSGCDPATGLCVWEESSRFDCAPFGFVCDDGDCVDPAEQGPCAGRDLCLPLWPDAFCDGERTVVRCEEDADGCRVRSEEPCDETEGCVEPEGLPVSCAFVDRCDGVACDAPPVPRCDGGDRVLYAAEGTCRAVDGGCDYAEALRETCAGETPRCVLQEGAPVCVDLCFGVSCAVAPSDRCEEDGDGLVAVRYVPDSGVCEAATGECAFAVEEEPCGDDTPFCLAGECLGVDCDDPDNCLDPACADAPACGFGVNFDFEDWRESDPPLGYTKAPATSWTVAESTEVVNTGERAARIDSQIDGNRDLRTSDYLRVEPDVTYTFHAWVNIPQRPANQWVRLGLTFLDAEDNRIGNRDFGPLFEQATSGWVELTHAASAPAGEAVFLKPFLRVQARGGWSLFTDSWAVTRSVSFDVDRAVEPLAREVVGGGGRRVDAAINNAGELYVSSALGSSSAHVVAVWVGEASEEPVDLPVAGMVAVPGVGAGGRLLVLAWTGETCSIWSRGSSGWTERSGGDVCATVGDRGVAVVGLSGVVGQVASRVPAALGFVGLDVEEAGVVGGIGPASALAGDTVPLGVLTLWHRAELLVGRP